MKKNMLLVIITFMFFSYQKPGDMHAKLVLDAKAMLGEGSIWHPIEKKLYWVDIEGKALHIYDPATKKDIQFATASRIGTVVPVKGGGVLVALQNGIHSMNTKTGNLTFITDPIQDTTIRFNDGKCDPAGRFWVGTMALNITKGAAVLYRLDRDKKVHLMLNNLTISNGIVWSADKKTMYFTDTQTSNVEAFDYNDTTGEISNRRVVIKVPISEGSPDGMAIDAEGKLWTALWGGGAVARWDPATGKMLQKIYVPAPNTSSCAFGGNDLKTLYITTARKDLSEEQLKQYPMSGGLFAVKLNIKGVPANFYINDDK